MSLEQPNKADIQKLNAEINQIINQRFTITLAAITVFGAIGAWIIPRTVIIANTQASEFVFYGCTLLIVLLLALFFYSHIIRCRAKTISSYLIIKKATNWEVAWRRYKMKPYLGYTKGQTIIFFSLGCITIVYPFLLALFSSQYITTSIGFWFHVSFGSVYLFFLLLLGWSKKGNIEGKTMKLWKQIDNES